MKWLPAYVIGLGLAGCAASLAPDPGLESLSLAKVAPDSIIERAPGELALKFTCPAKKKVRMTPGTLRAQIPESASVVAVEVPCK